MCFWFGGSGAQLTRLDNRRTGPRRRAGVAVVLFDLSEELVGLFQVLFQQVRVLVVVAEDPTKFPGEGGDLLPASPSPVHHFTLEWSEV